MFEISKIIEISEKEQRRIGQDLHDGLGQILTGIAFISKLLEKKLSARALAEADLAAEITELVKDAISQTHSLVSTLNPINLDSEGFILALEELTNNTKNIFGISCDFKYDMSVHLNDNAIGRHLYRIVQEAINNAIRHGKATNILINLSSFNQKVTLTVKDDGLGFNAVSNRSGMGLKIMKYRAQTIGATLDIQKSTDGGTIIICSFKQDQKNRGW